MEDHYDVGEEVSLVLRIEQVVGKEDETRMRDLTIMKTSVSIN